MRLAPPQNRGDPRWPKTKNLTLGSLITRLIRARAENRIERQLQLFAYPKVLIIDEMGYLPMNREEAGTPYPSIREGEFDYHLQQELCGLGRNL